MRYTLSAFSVFFFLSFFFAPSLTHAQLVCTAGVNGQTGATCRQYNASCPSVYADGCMNEQGCHVSPPDCPASPTPDTTPSAPAINTSIATASVANCVPGSEFDNGIFGDGGPGTRGLQCLNNITHVYINICRGNETVGPCAPARVDATAAAAAAAAAGPGCKAVQYGMGGAVDPTTGLQYFYSTVCPGEGSVSGTGTNIGGTTLPIGCSSLTGYSTTTGSPCNGLSATNSGLNNNDVYATSVINIVNNMIQSYKNILNSIPNTNTNANTTTNINTSNNNTATTLTNTSSCSFLTSDLRKGDIGSKVTDLTNMLVAEGLLSQPQNTFDDTVFQAVISYQEKYILAILTPAGLTRGTGFVGPNTRAFMNSSCILAQANSSPAGTTTTGTTGSTCSSSVWTKTNNFSYSFTKIGNSWKITLNNPALGTPTDFFYIPANATITATNASDLNTQAQARYNTMSYFPGNAVGNTFYQDVFGAFIAGYYDWANQIAKAPTCTTTTTNTTSSTNPMFTSTVTSFMHVGDPWGVIIAGLNPSETIYATGGKMINGVVPADKTPYTASNIGIFMKLGIHGAESIGSWQIVWTRANGAVLGTLTFSVQ